MNKINSLLIVCVISGFSFLCSNKNSGKEKRIEALEKTPLSTESQNSDTQNNEFNIYGKWKITRYISGNITAITDEQAKQYINKKMVLERDIAVILNDTCKNPVYGTHKENADKFFDINYRVSKSSLKIETNEITVTSLSCKGKPIYSSKDSPDFSRDIIFSDEKTIIMPINGFFFYLEKIPVGNGKVTPVNGDTVKCKYAENSSGCSGYIIQGTRKSGKVIHVKPFNKKVSLEAGEAPIEKHVDKKK